MEGLKNDFESANQLCAPYFPSQILLFLGYCLIPLFLLFRMEETLVLLESFGA